MILIKIKKIILTALNSINFVNSAGSTQRIRKLNKERELWQIEILLPAMMSQ